IRLTDSVSTPPVAKLSTRGRKEGRPSSGVNKAAKEIGVNREDARRAVKVDSLSSEALQTAIALKLDDNRSALLAAAKHDDPGMQQHVLRTWGERTAKKKKAVDVEPGDGTGGHPAECRLAADLRSVIILGVHPCRMHALMDDCNNA